MAEILLVNPRRRRRRKSASKARRRRRSAPRAVRRRRRRRVARIANPRRRSRRSLTRSVRRRRRNPSLRGMTAGVVPLLKDGFMGASGALGLDLLWGQGKKFLPASIAGSAIAQYAAKLVGAILIGVIGNKLKPGSGRALSVGAATVVLHDAMKAQVAATFPSLPLGEYLTFAPTVGSMQRAGRLMSTGMGEYLSGLPDQTDDMSYSGDYSADGMNGY
jgi:hypothetical protein